MSPRYTLTNPSRPQINKHSIPLSDPIPPPISARREISWIMMDSQASPTYAFISTTSTTYHPENPLENAIIDNPELLRRRRRKTSARELEVLEMAFRECDKPSREAKRRLLGKLAWMEKLCRYISLFGSRRREIASQRQTVWMGIDGRYGFRINDSHCDDYPNWPLQLQEHWNIPNLHYWDLCYSLLKFQPCCQ